MTYRKILTLATAMRHALVRHFHINRIYFGSNDKKKKKSDRPKC